MLRIIQSVDMHGKICHHILNWIRMETYREGFKMATLVFGGKKALLC